LTQYAPTTARNLCIMDVLIVTTKHHDILGELCTLGWIIVPRWLKLGNMQAMTSKCYSISLSVH